MTLLLVAVALLVVALLVLPGLYKVHGTNATVLIAMSAIVVSVGVFPRELITFVSAPDGLFADIGSNGISVTTFSAGVVLGFLLMFGAGRIRFPLYWGIFVAVLLFKMLTVWQGNVLQWSGFIAILLGVMAWIIGTIVGETIFTSISAANFFLGLVLAILLFQLLVGFVQLANVSLPSWFVGTDRTLESSLGRVAGTIGHPANLSKIVFLLLILVLPFTISSARSTRRLAVWCTLVGVVVAGLTISRSNIVALLILLVLWVVTLPGRAKFLTRAGGLIGVAVAALVFAPLVLDRFAEDATGGQRPALLAAGLDQLARDLWTGTGPNYYITVVSNFDAATATGYPVHNAVLLLVAELGLPVAAMFFAPFVVVVLLNVFRLNRSADFMHVPRVILFALPGFAIIISTGWALIAGFSVVLLMFVISALSSVSRARGKSEHFESMPSARPVENGSLRYRAPVRAEPTRSRRGTADTR